MTIFGHRKGSGKISDNTGVPGGLPEPPGGLMGLMGLKWRRGGAARAGRAPPPPLVRIGQGGGRRPPFLLSLYISTISRLLVMSPISSGTPKSFGTSKLIITV